MKTTDIDIRQLPVNRIINGDFGIGQRGTTALQDDAYGLDRWYLSQNGSMAATQGQVSDVPSWSKSLFSNRIDITAASGGLVGSNNLQMRQRIEGYFISDLIGKTINVSFNVKTNKLGIYTIALKNEGLANTIMSKFEVTTLNTWERVTLDFEIDDTVTFNKTNLTGIELAFSFGASATLSDVLEDSWQAGNFLSITGSVDMSDTIGNYMQLSDVMVYDASHGEVEFQRAGRNYQEELQLCQRYYSNQGVVAHHWATMNAGDLYRFNPIIHFPISMRNTPVVLIQDSSLSLIVADLNAAAPLLLEVSRVAFSFRNNVTGPLGIPDRYLFWAADAEL